ncbi:hypothetical protein [uncultured Pseudokineococcus sp.]|uniref:hypothetical protein n=1 Tax=uncultured Pseudokineococcus sp. TaxID=1642928 RepID=UPI0026336634|nr:hypothetical protein [uncultured Pseudokineococcus sp.]
MSRPTGPVDGVRRALATVDGAQRRGVAVLAVVAAALGAAVLGVGVGALAGGQPVGAALAAAPALLLLALAGTVLAALRPPPARPTGEPTGPAAGSGPVR